ncbi:M14 family metallopeptidase [Thiorhodovibrio frisius]|uniref:Putative deacylase n=1 Tax=Thiorhodovibrio frisius TaxID=631362 RepID=H8Z734_9GAMM|nr:M14 family metallopeptidase [Thiorhodovibrio frisius]EIC20833.1 putative deacylase [Thiorhodovibrio frisius]WPL21885.1 Succinylglutamate desuccinylase / Aspartoacylase family protein [Thiorhodovibrio frisius]
MAPPKLSLIELNQLPPGLLDCDSQSLASILGGPALIHLSGERKPALFVSVLMHGNESVGWDAMRLVLRERLGKDGAGRLPRALSLFIGNPAAAAVGLRHLPEQPDFNRVWPGSELAPTTPEHAIMARVVERMSARGCFASIDLHNNTGNNPHYGCLNRIEPPFLQLAALFSRTVVYFIRPRGVQSQAFAELCPAVTLECGKAGQQYGIEHARNYIDSCLDLDSLSDQPPPAQDIDLFHTVAQVKIATGLEFGFPPRAAELLLSPELEQFNFRELAAGTPFARLDSAKEAAFDVRDENGQDVGARFFELKERELRLRIPAMPSMLTRDERVIRQDCLCYLMERYKIGA